LPTSNGKWAGPEGESGWISDKPEVIAITKGEPIPYKNQRPNFSKWAVDEISMEPGELNGEHKHDRRVAINKFIRKGKWETTSEADQWLRDNRMSIHHAGNHKMQLIPKDLNDVKHTGEAADLRSR
jgi:hypothetical protein